MNFTGYDMASVQRVFVTYNSTSCSNVASPYDIDFTRIGVGQYQTIVNQRGYFTVCYIGLSGTAYGVLGNKLQIFPRVQSFTAAQDGVYETNLTVQKFFTGYPISVTIIGGALDYSLDKFFAVSGSSCDVLDAVPLTSTNPPLTVVNSLTLSFVAEYAGGWRICYKLDGATSGTVIPGLVISIQSSLIYSNGTLRLQGPAVAPDVMYEFAFGLASGCSSCWTVFEVATTSNRIDVPYIPLGAVRFRCNILSAQGTLKYAASIVYESAGSVSFCSLMPQALIDSGSARQFAMRLLAVQNYIFLKCYDVLPANTVRDASALVKVLLVQIGADATLVTDPLFFFDVLTTAITKARQLVAETTEELEALLENSVGTLNRPASTITPELLNAHIEIVDLVSVKLYSSASMGSATLQKLGLECLDRLKLVGNKHCESPNSPLT